MADRGSTQVFGRLDRWGVEDGKREESQGWLLLLLWTYSVVCASLPYLTLTTHPCVLCTEHGNEEYYKNVVDVFISVQYHNIYKASIYNIEIIVQTSQ